ncbi:MAG TPA: hypothetical protein VD968_18350 [Pyrinomonadaceae bacterium]|nr:hypothetical protein [Pyrinomonadaceae bacterium]
MTPNPHNQPAETGRPPIVRYGCGLPALGLALLSAFFVIAAVSDMVINRDPKETPVLIGMAFLFGAATALCLFVARHFLRKVPAPPNVDTENRILQLAYQRGGRLKVSFVALHCRLSIEESRTWLERMASQGVAVPEVDDDGNIAYAFPELLPERRAPEALTGGTQQKP